MYLRYRIATVAVFFLLFIFASQAIPTFKFHYVYQDEYTTEAPAGFVSGVWHGLIAPYSFLVNLFGQVGPQFQVGMYAVNNDGPQYNLGFLFGVAFSLHLGWIAALISFIAIFL